MIDKDIPMLFGRMRLESKKAISLILIQDFLTTIAFTTLVFVNFESSQNYFPRVFRNIFLPCTVFPLANCIFIISSFRTVFKGTSFNLIKAYYNWRSVQVVLGLAAIVGCLFWINYNASLTAVKLRDLKVSPAFIDNFEREYFTNNVIFTSYFFYAIFDCYLTVPLRKAIGSYSSGSIDREIRPHSARGVIIVHSDGETKSEKKRDELLLVEASESETKRKILQKRRK